MQSNAFARSRAMFAAISAIVASVHSPFAQLSAIGELGEYKSRGHGGRHKRQGRFLSYSYYPRSKYSPHQGAQECARRRRQNEPTPGNLTATEVLARWAAPLHRLGGKLLVDSKGAFHG